MSGGYGNNPIIQSLGRQNAAAERLARLIYPPMPTLNIMHSAKLGFLRKMLFQPDGVVVNIGAGGLTGCGCRLWQGVSAVGAKVYNLDIDNMPDVNVVADAHSMPFCEASVDSLVCQAVLEHVKDPGEIIKEAHRVLKPGGLLYLEVPFLQGFHADPHDFQRYTLEGLRHLTATFKEIDAGVSVGPVCAMIWIIRDAMSSCFTNKYLYLTSRFFWGWILSPFRYLDYLSRNNKAAARLACEYYFLCQKN